MWHHLEKIILVDVSPWLQASGIWDERKVKGRRETGSTCTLDGLDFGVAWSGWT